MGSPRPALWLPAGTARIPQPNHRWSCSSGPSPEWLQDQQPYSSGSNQPPRARSLFIGYGWTPYFVEGSDLESMHQAMAATLEKAVLEIRGYQKEARESGKAFRPLWPMIVLRSPKGWTGPRKSMVTIWKGSGDLTKYLSQMSLPNLLTLKCLKSG